MLMVRGIFYCGFVDDRSNYHDSLQGSAVLKVVRERRRIELSDRNVICFQPAIDLSQISEQLGP